MLTDKTNKHVLGTSELTCVLPIRQDIIPNLLDTRTYLTRLLVAMRLLHGLRLSSREAQHIRPIVDAVDAIRGIYAFSFSVRDGKEVILSVTFDKPWEPYIRIIWRDLGPVLDLVLCNCEGYDHPALEQGYEKFVAWIVARQVQSEFFFAQGRLTVDDQRYLAEAERIARDSGPRADLELAELTVPDPAEEAITAARAITAGPNRVPVEALRQYGAALSALFGLREFYVGDDERFLRSAAGLLLKGLSERMDPALPPTFLDGLRAALPVEVKWFESITAAVGTVSTRDRPAGDVVQGGILSGFSGATHGCVLLWRFTDAALARAFTRNAGFTSQAAQADIERKWRAYDPLGGALPTVAANVAFTVSGLDKLGVAEADLRRFPREFLQGMEARAGLLGDVRGNHPDHWTLPAWNGSPAPAGAGVVHLASVDMVITLRTKFREVPGDHEWSSAHPLFADVQRLIGLGGAELLSIEPLRTYRTDKRAREPFGFADGISQPRVGAAPGHAWNDDVPVGDLVVGHENSHKDPPFPPPATGGARWEQGSLIDNGSFLVVRKLRQFVNRLKRVADMAHTAGTREEVMAALVGRTSAGVPLAAPSIPSGSSLSALNDFDYRADTTGRMCPFDSHVRRTNPRTPGRSPLPRIARRGMSYGPPSAIDAPIERETNGDMREPERGTMFMAYNASIAEQFEVIQRWITGGNSTGLASVHADPLMRVPDLATGPYTRRIVDGTGQVVRVDLGNDPFVKVEWGLYLFAPSMDALAQLASGIKSPSSGNEHAMRGEAIIKTLTDAKAWATIMEDLTANRSGAQSAVLAAIRDLHGGVLATPFGVIVADATLMDQVLGDDETYSVREYLPRMHMSVGEGYLGLDRGTEYSGRSTLPNDVVARVDMEPAFAEAYKHATALLAAALENRPRPATLRLEPIVDSVLAQLCAAWFGVPDADPTKPGVAFIKRGGKTRDPQDVRLPFHSLAPSRYIFSSPAPRFAVVQQGQAFGAALLAAVRQFVAHHRATGAPPPGTLTVELFDGLTDDDVLARTIVGMLEGFLPTVYGNLLKTINYWLTDETFWPLQRAHLSSSRTFAEVQSTVLPALMTAMQTRPVPELLYRTATKDTTLGGQVIKAGEKVVTSIVAVTEAGLRNPVPDVRPIFGGDRRAPGHPTHACPAMDMGVGVMLGVLVAMLELPTVKSTAANLVITVG